MELWVWLFMLLEGVGKCEFVGGEYNRIGVII